MSRSRRIRIFKHGAELVEKEEKKPQPNLEKTTVIVHLPFLRMNYSIYFDIDLRLYPTGLK